MDYVIGLSITGVLLCGALFMFRSQESRDLERKKSQAAERAKFSGTASKDDAERPYRSSRRSSRQFGRR